jgi:hypothetical protein
MAGAGRYLFLLSGILFLLSDHYYRGNNRHFEWVKQTSADRGGTAWGKPPSMVEHSERLTGAAIDYRGATLYALQQRLRPGRSDS